MEGPSGSAGEKGSAAPPKHHHGETKAQREVRERFFRQLMDKEQRRMAKRAREREQAREREREAAWRRKEKEQRAAKARAATDAQQAAQQVKVEVVHNTEWLEQQRRCAAGGAGCAGALALSGGRSPGWGGVAAA